MKLFLDTANIDEIRQGTRMGVVHGITTNPSLAAKEGIGQRDAYKAAVQEIAKIVDGPISVEVVSVDVEGMITEGRDIAGWIPNPWVKLPSAPVGSPDTPSPSHAYIYKHATYAAHERHPSQPHRNLPDAIMRKQS